MSDSSQKETGTMQVLLNRLETLRLPRALDLQKKVERGECLNEADTQFLDRVFEESRDAVRLANKHPELQPLIARITKLYADITSKGLENQQKNS